MAKIRNKHLFTFDLATWGRKVGKTVTVGHNRTLEISNNGQILTARLHGHAVARFVRNGIRRVTVQVDPCGYYTTTTRQAINDFLDAAGIRAGVSVSPKYGTISGRFFDGEGYRYIDPVDGGFCVTLDASDTMIRFGQPQPA